MRQGHDRDDIHNLARELRADIDRRERERAEMRERLAARDAAYAAAFGPDYGRERKTLNLRPALAVAEGECAHFAHGLSIAGRRAKLRKVRSEAAAWAVKAAQRKEAAVCG